ncbi:2OG-Fe(II) oxygenase [Moorena producens JHB]|uniref:2OG-Fe(II) oxygenase n=1 Tax=Moorena producens (strain JHB) TaxID=1454205 RepID=A0A1D9G4S5_MOOP1|nr:2OG-Fe(II) oxygenase [Moorena producens]AOY82642.1 2OG-Fe(II) oxygenase [Moorena producens JHB]
MLELSSQYSDLRYKFAKYGVLVLSLNETPMTAEDYQCILNISGKTPTSSVTVGDRGETHNLEVGRLKTDTPYLQTLTSTATVIENILLKEPMKAFFQFITCAKFLEIRRIQLNVMRPGGYIGAHYDNDSDPLRHLAIIIHLQEADEGGDLVVYDEGGSSYVYHPLSTQMVLSAGDLLHEVTPVVRGERRTLVAFLSIKH